MEDRSVNSSSSFRKQCIYDVFLSFTGQDTRYTFTGNLYNALCQNGIHTFIDDEELKRGERISQALPKAIGLSRISIIIFSENYAVSRWCLDELVNIIQCKTKERLVWPVFYKVDPSDVRHQRGSFGRAMAKHERRFKGDPAKVQKWRWALTEAADLSGLHFKISDGYEFKFIKGIIEAASFILNHTPLYVAEHPIELELRISSLSSLLGMSSNDKRMIGIHGLGGVGKTTLAKALYNEIANQFEGASFVADVGENSSKRGLLKLQEEFLAEIIGKKNIDLCHVDRGIPIIEKRLCCKKVLLILDDVQKSEHLEKLAGSLEWFGPGSRIIVTTRDKHLLEAHGIVKLHEMKCLSHDKAIQLFCWHAFRSSKPKLGYERNILPAVEYANGLPLALKVIGCNLCCKTPAEWGYALDKYKGIPPTDIHNKLKISYDDLEENEKEIFLDLACFFKGEHLEYVEKVLDACGFYPKDGIRRLIDKSLIEIEHNTITMHNLIQEMGREIVTQNTRSNPGERSRLWFYDDILQVLIDNTGTHKTEAIVMKLYEKQEVQWSGNAFIKMPKLRMLIVQNALFFPAPTHLPNSLKVLEWSEYPSSSLPKDFHPRRLAVMCLPNSHLTKLKSFKGFECLTYMDFTASESLTTIPDMSSIPNLTTLLLDYCENLVEIHDSVGFLGKLVTLSAYNCSTLESFPGEIKLTSLKCLNLKRCYKLQCFPNVLEKMENTFNIDLSHTAIEELPSSMENISALPKLTVNSNSKLWDLPRSIEMLSNLNEISIKCCPQIVQSFKSIHDFRKLRHYLLKRLLLYKCGLSDEELPTIVHCFPNIEYLNLSENNLVKVPACFKQLYYLKELWLEYCELLEEIEGVPPHLATLRTWGSKRLKLTSELTNVLKSNNQRQLRSTPSEDQSEFRSEFAECFSHFLEDPERITEAASCVQNHSPLYVAEHPVGLKSRLSDLGLLLDMRHDDVRFIGIWGMDGIGKTTLARAMYNEIADQFDCASFVADVGEESLKRGGLVKLREKILVDILGQGNMKLINIDMGNSVIRNILRFKKVLLILDDVYREEQKQILAPNVDGFGPGSRIVITARDRELLSFSGSERIYEMKGLSDDESLELFSWHAFKREVPLRGYAYDTKRAVQYARGLPLALEILGSHLCGKELGECKCALDTLEKYRKVEFYPVPGLQMIYDDLGGNEKEILLNLACFFTGEELDYVEKILDACGFHAKSGIGVLIDKCLIKVENNRIKIHHLIQDFGKLIGRREGRHAVLHNGFHAVWPRHTGKDKIEGIMLDLEEEKKSLKEELKMHWSGDAFKMMPKLRVLVIRNALFSRGPMYLSNSLKVLEWIKYPSPSLPEDFHPTELITMSLPHSRLTLLKPFKENKNLIVVDFTGCNFLEKIPDMSAVPNLTILKLDLCQNLVEIHDSVGFLGKLVTLSARSCIMLESFPHEIRMASLENLDLGGFSCLQCIPDAFEEQENMATDDLRGTAIEGLPSSLGNASKLKYLRLDYCTHLSNIPSSIGMLTNLTNISMVSCPLVIPSLISNLGFGKFRYPFVSNLNLQQCGLPDEALPVIVCCFPNLVYLNLSSNDFSTVSACINELHSLQRFHLDDCILLKEIEGYPPNLVLLTAINCNRLTSKSINILGLAHQGSPTRNLEIALPATVIPECCDHYFGQDCMSFYCCKNFPDIPICLGFEIEHEEKLEDCYATFGIYIRINSLRFLEFEVARDCNKTPNHVRLIRLHSYIFECSTVFRKLKNAEKFLRFERNRVEILWEVYFFRSTERFHFGKRVPGRVRIWGNQTTTEDILFREPPESRFSHILSSTTYNDDNEAHRIAMPCQDGERDLSTGIQNIWTEEDDCFSDDDSIICIPESRCSDTLSSTTYNDDNEAHRIAGDDTRMPCQDRERDLSTAIQNILTEEDDCFSDDDSIIPDEKCPAGGQANDATMASDPEDVEYQRTSQEDQLASNEQSSTRDEGTEEMMGSNQGNQWRFSLCAVISSVVLLCSSSSPDSQ